jgi:hypothetical protein
MDRVHERGDDSVLIGRWTAHRSAVDCNRASQQTYAVRLSLTHLSWPPACSAANNFALTAPIFLLRFRGMAELHYTNR